MRIGLVLVTWNAEAFIARTLDAVGAQTRPPDRIVIVDNGSDDGTWRILHDFSTARGQASSSGSAGSDVRLIQAGDNIGFAAANNLAVAELADCELLALLNPDAVPDPSWLAELERAAEAHPEAASFASRLMQQGRPGSVDGAGDVCHVSGIIWRRGHGRPLADVPEATDAGPVFSACAAAALYRRPDWLRAGGLDERFYCYAEDVDLGFRLQLAGRACWYVPDAVVHHAGSASAGVDSPFAVYHGHRNLEWLFVKNMPGALLWRYLPLHAMTWVAGFLRFATRGRGGAYLRAKRDAILGLPQAWRDRRRVQSARVLSARQVLARLDRSSLWRRFTA